MFKLGNLLSIHDKNQIKENTRLSFGHESLYDSHSHDNALIYKDNRIVCCAVVEINQKFIYNLCTHPNYRRQGYSKQLMKLILEKYRNIKRNQLLLLQTENDERGKIPQRIYRNLNWINQVDKHNNYRNNMMFLPQTCICEAPNRLIKDQITKYGNFLNHLDNNILGISIGIAKYILGENNTIIFEDYHQSNNKLNNYQNLINHIDFNNSNVLFNHIIFIDKTRHCKETIKYIKQNFISKNNILIIFIYKNNFFIINKLFTDIEYIVSSKIKHFKLLHQYLNI